MRSSTQNGLTRSEGGTDLPVVAHRPRPVNPLLLAAGAPCLTVASVIIVWGLMRRDDGFGLVVEHAVYWYTCALFTPVIWWASERVALHEGRLTPVIALQGCTAPIFVAGHVTLLAAARWFVDAGSPEIGSLWQVGREFVAKYAALDLATWSALVAVSHAVIFHDRAGERGCRAARLEAQLVDARLQTLQQRLQPHLLFNALHAISALMHRDVELADRTLSDLSELLRTTLEQAGRQQVPLAAELALVRTYLRIEQTRFAERLVVRFDVQPDALDGLVPTLLLQPIVENAIKHGIAKNRDTGPHRHLPRGEPARSCGSRCATTEPASRRTPIRRSRRASGSRPRGRDCSTSTGPTSGSSSTRVRVASASS